MKNLERKGGEKKMKVIVVQTIQEDLERIRRYVAKLNPERADEIIYESDPRAVKLIESEEAIVISGNVFESSLANANTVARFVKGMDSKALFFIFSVDPPLNPDYRIVDGMIKKPWENDSGFKYLAEILASDLIGITPEMLKEKFPKIQIFVPHNREVGIRVEKDF